MERDVFISYSHKDKAISDAVCHTLESKKMKCWMAPRDIKPGADWAETISKAIPKCKLLLLVFSSNSNISKQVLREVKLAVDNNLIIIPARIEDINPSAGMSYYLSTVHWIDVINEKTVKQIKIISETVSNILLSGEIEITQQKPIPSKQKQIIKREWIIIPAVVILVGIMLFVFRESIFSGDNNSIAAIDEGESLSESIEMAQVPTMEITVAPTPETIPTPTAEITPTPAPTFDPNASLDMVVNIPDSSLKSAIINQLEFQGVTVDGNITVADMHKLEELVIVSSSEAGREWDTYDVLYKNISKSNIETLDGLQYAKNLKKLIISDLDVKDISVLSHIYELEYIDIRINSVEDLSPIANNVYLKHLNIDYNYIEDITVLETLSELEHLSISGNPISSISVLQNLSRLRGLIMARIDCPDISIVFELVSLEYIDIFKTNIELLAPFLELNNLNTIVIDSDMEHNNEETIKQLHDNGCYVDVAAR